MGSAQVDCLQNATSHPGLDHFSWFGPFWDFLFSSTVLGKVTCYIAPVMLFNCANPLEWLSLSKVWISKSCNVGLCGHSDQYGSDDQLWRLNCFRIELQMLWESCMWGCFLLLCGSFFCVCQNPFFCQNSGFPRIATCGSWSWGGQACGTNQLFRA